MWITHSTLLTLASVISISLLFNGAESAPASTLDVAIPSVSLRRIAVPSQQLDLDGYRIEKRRRHKKHEKKQGKNSHKKITSVKKTSGSSSSSGTFKGKGTWYNTGLGSCGVANKESDMIVALNANQMTESYSGNPNNNPLCGKKINVRNPKNGREVTVKVQDTCPGCPSGDSLDLSPGAFKKIASLDDGVIDIAWSWA